MSTKRVAIDNLVDALKRYQEQNKLSDGEFAQILQIDRSMLSYIKSYKRNPGPQTLRALAALSPEFHELVIDYMFDGNGKSSREERDNGTKKQDLSQSQIEKARGMACGPCLGGQR